MFKRMLYPFSTRTRGCVVVSQRSCVLVYLCALVVPVKPRRSKGQQGEARGSKGKQEGGGEGVRREGRGAPVC